MNSQARNSASVSWTEIKKEYPPEKFIHVLPAEDSLFNHGSPQWRLDITRLKFDPSDPKDCYPIEKRNYKDESGKWQENVSTVGLTKGALERLSSAAGVSIVGPNGTPNLRTDDGSDPLTVEFSVFAVLSSKGGEIRTMPAGKSWNGRVRQEVKRREAEKKFDRKLSGDRKVEVPGHHWKSSRDCSPEERALVVDGWFRDEWLREREYGPAMAETKCVNRARRALLGLSAKYSFEEIRDKEFIVPRWVFEPDISDPEIRKMVVSDGLAAQRRAFALPHAAGNAPPRLSAGPSPHPSGTKLIKPIVEDEAEELADEALESGPVMVSEETPVEESPAEVFDDIFGDDPPAVDCRGDVDVEAIEPEKLSFTVAKYISSYAGTKDLEVMAKWEEFSKIKNPIGFDGLRKVLRHVLKYQKGEVR